MSFKNVKIGKSKYELTPLIPLSAAQRGGDLGSKFIIFPTFMLHKQILK
jgi:hypothetical protein